MADIQNLLHFRGQALTQFVLVATIFGAFAMSGVIALLAGHERARLRSALFVLLSLASLIFVFATVLSVIILPFMGAGVVVSDKAARGLLFLYAIVVVSIILGTLLLVAGIAGVGFMVSKRVGHCTLWSTVAVAIAFALSLLHLVSVMR